MTVRTTGAMPNSFDPASAADLPPRLNDLITRRRSLLGPGYRLMYKKPLEIVRGEGVLLYDADGREYLDAYNNVPVVGHCNARVVRAITDQARVLNTNTRYLSEDLLRYTERLLATQAPGIGSVMYTCTGSEANDLALRIARYATGATGVIVTRDAYHGVTTAVAEISPSLGPNVPLGQHVRSVALPQSRSDVSLATASAEFAANVAGAIADLKRHGIGLAALVADTIFATDGGFPDPAGFVGRAVDLVAEAGGLFIADEVQAGFGRTGDAMWGYERHGVKPDMVTTGKPMGNGMPIAAVAARPELVEAFGRDVRYFNTFGANSVSIAAAAAVLDAIDEDGLIANSRVVGGRLRAELAGLSNERPYLRRVRGAGLYIAGDIVDPATEEPDTALAVHIANELKERGVLISTVGPAGSTLKIRPPLPFGQSDADRFLDAAEDVFNDIDGRLGGS